MLKHLFSFLIFSSIPLLADYQDRLVPVESSVVLTLESAISRSLGYNRQIIQISEAAIQAGYGIQLAEREFDLTITPNGQAGYAGGGHAGNGTSLGVGVDINKKWPMGTLVSVSPSISKIAKHYHSDLRVLISQPLLKGFGQDAQLTLAKGAEFAWRTAYRALHTAQVQLTIRTIQALYEVVKAKKAMELNQESYQRVEKFYQAAKLKEKIGLSDALDVYRAEIELRHAQDELISSQERLLDTQDTVRDLLALPLDTIIQVEVPLIYVNDTLSLSEAIEIALQNRIEMDQAEDQLRENYRLSYLAKKNLYPDLNLVFNYSNCGTDEIFARACTRHREDTWGIGFTTSSEFDPVGDQIAYQQSLIAIQSAKRETDQAKATIILDVKKTLRQLERTHKKMHLQAEQIKTAEGELYLSQLKFARGMTENFTIIQAEKSLRFAQTSYWGALIDHIVGHYQFLSAMGLLTDKIQY